MKRNLITVLFIAGLLFSGLALFRDSVAAQPVVFINEIHYDNTGTDSGEAVEIAGPAGTDLTGWSLVRYNGSNGQVYTTPTADPAGSDVLSGTIPDLGGGFGVVVVNYLSNGLQNGAPDGIALVDNSNSVVQFLSYEGSFTAVDGPAAGKASVDIGVSESGSGAVGNSLQLSGAGTTYADFTWAAEAPNTFGSFNTGQTFAVAITPPFVNELHYDNDGADADEGIEVAGPASTDLTGWSLVLYNGNGGAPYDTINLAGSIPDQDNGYGTLWFPRAGIQNGSPDGFALVDDGGNVLQFLSYEGTFTAVGGPADGMASTDIGVSEGSGTPAGFSLQLAGTGSSYADFTWQAPQAHTYGSVNTNQSFGGVVNAPVVVECGSWLNTFEGNVASRSVSASDADGTVVSMSIEVTPIPASGTISLQNFVAAAAPGETATGEVVVDADVPAGIYEVTVTAANSDAEPQESTCSFNVDVDPFLTIGEVQGVVGDDDIGTSHASPYVGEYVALQGVIYEKTQEYRSAGGAFYGFFLQNTADQADGDPNTSDGIFVFHLQFPTLLVESGGSYVPQIGDEVILRGPVQERFNNTRLNNPRLVQVVRSGVDLDAEIPAFEVDPPAAIVDDTNFDDIQDAYRYWERHEGMRAQVPANSIAIDGRDVFASTFDSEVWVARPDSLIALLADDYQRRSFRDVHPLDDIPSVGFDNDNPYRILIGTFGVKATLDDTTALLAPSRTFDKLTQAVIGGVYFNFGKYSVQAVEQIQLAQGVDPSLNNPPPAPDPELEYNVAVFNVENLYDYVDDPFDGCDFTGNAGCPGVSPPFDYVPPSDAVYQERLGQIAMQVIQDLHSPDIILVQEAEDQDICLINEGVYECGTINDADGKPDTIQELAAKIYELGGPLYDAAYDRDGADDRGIVSAYLFRSDRVELLPAMADDPVLGSDPQVYYPDGEALPYNTDVQNPKALNAVLPDYVTGSTDGDNVFTRPPQVAHFRVWRLGLSQSVYQDIYLSNNHFSSGPDGRVGQRTEQALYNARIVAALQAADSMVYASVGGDLNVYPRPDDPFPPPDTSDQLAALYEASLVNLWDIMVAEDPVSAFSYVYQGQTQTLDQLFTSPSWLSELTQANMAHINADFPADYPGDGPRGTSDHDPVVALYTLYPTLDRLESLVLYYEASGDILGNNTTKILLDRIERARRFEENGQEQAYADQLYAFASQVLDLAPDQITQSAAEVLANEALLLLSLP